MEICGQFLFRQLLAIRPKAICVLGGTAAKALLVPGRASPNCAETGRTGTTFRSCRLSPLVSAAAYSQNAKRESWEDLKKVLHYVFD